MRKDSVGSLDAEALEPRGESRRLDAEDLRGSPGPRNPPTGLFQGFDDIVAFLSSQVLRRQHLAVGGMKAILEDSPRRSQLHPSRECSGVECPLEPPGTTLGQDDRRLAHIR